MDDPLDIEIIEQISEYTTESFAGIVYRSTSKNAVPIAPSYYGGR